MNYNLTNLTQDMCDRRIRSMCGCNRKELAGHHHAAVFFRSGTAPPLLKVHGLR